MNTKPGDLHLLEAGAMIEETYWAVPADATPGHRYDSHAEALDASVKRTTGRRSAHQAHYGSAAIEFPERLWVDLRWRVKVAGGTSDMVAVRHEYSSIAEAEEHLTGMLQRPRPFPTTAL